MSICRHFLFPKRPELLIYHSRFGRRNGYSKTDVDATFIPMKDDHMRNAQLKPGYNVQIRVDSEYIIAADIFSDRNDVWTLVPFLREMGKNLGFHYPCVTADILRKHHERGRYKISNEPFHSGGRCIWCSEK